MRGSGAANQPRSEGALKNGCIHRSIAMLVLFCSAFLFLPEASYADPDIPEDNLSYPVLLIGKDGSTGSGFFYNKDDATYLITARHVLFKETTVFIPEQLSIPKSLKHKLFIGENKPDKGFALVFHGTMSQEDKDELTRTISGRDDVKFKKAIEELFRNSQELKLKNDKIALRSIAPSRFGGKRINEIEIDLAKLLEDEHIGYHPSHDVAYIRIGIPKGTTEQKQVDLVRGVTGKQVAGFLGVAGDNFKLLSNVYEGNQVFVFGYPTTISGIDAWLDIGLPLLRKGIVAGINHELKAIILDCPVFGGNSGGLVIEIERTSLTELKYRAIGVIANFVPYQRDWYQNSGYSVVVPMDFVEEMLETEKGSRDH